MSWNDPILYGRDWYFDGVNKYGYRLYDGIKAMVREWAPTMTHNVSINGTEGKTSFNVGLGYLDQSGMTKPASIDDFKRYNAPMSFTSEVNKALSCVPAPFIPTATSAIPGGYHSRRPLALPVPLEPALPDRRWNGTTASPRTN